MALICVVARLANKHELFAAPRRLASETIAPETRLMWDLFRGSLATVRGMPSGVRLERLHEESGEALGGRPQRSSLALQDSDAAREHPVGKIAAGQIGSALDLERRRRKYRHAESGAHQPDRC